MGLGIWAWDAFGVPWGWAQRLGLKAPGAYGAIKQRALGGSSWGMGALRAPLGRMGPSAPLGDQGALNETACIKKCKLFLGNSEKTPVGLQEIKIIQVFDVQRAFCSVQVGSAV